MQRVITLLLLVMIVLIAAHEPALAGNKFTTIGGGVVGSSYEKIKFLKSLSGIFGGFLVALGLLSFATRSRFEGLIGMVTGRTFEAVTVVPAILIIMGSLMVLYYLL